MIRLERWTRPRRWSAVLVVAVSLFSAAACTSQQDGSPEAPGPEIDADQGGAYGWHKAISNRAGVEVIYEYEGVRKRAVIPSHLTICAPANAPCEAQE